MTNELEEYKNDLKHCTLREVIDDCIYYANDGYYRDLESVAAEELDKRFSDIGWYIQYIYNAEGKPEEVRFPFKEWTKILLGA